MKINKMGFLLAGVVFLPGCMRVASYKPKSLGLVRSINSTFTYRSVQNNIILAVSRLDDTAKSYLFSDRNILLDGENSEIIHISLHNLSDLDYSICPEEIDLTQITYHDVLRSIQTSSTHYLKKAGIVGGSVYGISSALIVTTFLSLFATSSYGKAGLICLYCVGYGLGAFLPVVAVFSSLPFVGRSIKSAIMNGRIEKDLKQKMVHKKVIIKSGDHYEGLIFVKASDYKSQFNVMIAEQDNRDNKIAFEIDLQQG